MPSKDVRQYARVSVDLPSNRKLAGMPPQAKWLSVVGVLWSTQNSTDGHVNPAVILAVSVVPPRFAKHLTDTGIWHKKGHKCDDCPQPLVAGEVVIHHFLKHQDDAATVRKNRDEKAKSGRLANHLRWKHAGPIEACVRCSE